MNSIFREWLKQLYVDEIAATEKTISNEKLWLNGCDDGEECHSHITNIMQLEEYISILKGKMAEIEEE